MLFELDFRIFSEKIGDNMKKLFFIALLFISTNLFANPDKNFQVSLSGNYLFESENLYFVEVDRFYFFGDAFIFKTEIDYYLDGFANNFGLGFFANIGSPWYDGFEETSMTEFGPTLKWKIRFQKMIIIPALYIGFRSYDGDAGDGLGLNLSLKAQYPQDNFIPFIDICFLSQPAGGNDATDITYAPVFILGAGVAFNL